MLSPDRKLAIYMEASLTGPSGKMGFGIIRYSPNEVVCVIDSTQAGRSTAEFDLPKDIPIVASVAEAHAMGADTFVLGIAPLGGVIPAPWFADIDDAAQRGTNLVNGLHDFLGPRYQSLQPGQFVWDIRREPADLKNGTGAAANLPAERVLFIGTDMAVGKMTAGLEIHAEALRRGIRSGFVATGQIGITITGRGVPLDAIRVDFASGAIEREVVSWANEGADLILVEGQGALCHPASTANLPLLRGSMPTRLVLCLRAGQTHLRMAEHIPIPPLGTYIRLYEDLAEACGTFPRPSTVAVAVNTAGMSDVDALAELDRIEAEVGLPTVDPIRQGPGRLLDAILR